MSPHHRRLIGLLGPAILMSSGGWVSAWGQAPAPSDPAPTQAPSTAARSMPAVPEHVRPQASHPQKRRSIVHHYPYPYPGYYHGDEMAGFRNPGSVGRYAEYYPAGGAESQLEREHVPAAPPVARFDTNPETNYQNQMRASSIGIQRYNSIQGHIDNMARPTWGYGFGAGGFGGFW